MVPGEGGTQVTTWTKDDRIEGAALPTSSNSHMEVLEGDAPWITPPGLLLDVGCGGGQFLKAASLMGLDCTGMDADPRMVAASREHSGCEVHHRLVGYSYVAPGPISGGFNYVTAFEVVEHLHDVPDGLRWMLACLATGGWLVGAVPDMGVTKVSQAPTGPESVAETAEEIAALNRHVSAFDPEGVRFLLESVGFVDVETVATMKGRKKRVLFRGRRP